MSAYTSTNTDFSLKSQLLTNYLDDTREITLDEHLLYVFGDSITEELPFQQKGELNHTRNNFKYNALLLPLPTNKNKKLKNVIITKDMSHLDFLVSNKEYILPVNTFIGNRRLGKNSRETYSIVLDLDDVTPNQCHSLIDLIHSGEIPKPNIIVNSGKGLHLYYNLDKPITMYETQVELYNKLKYELLDLVWRPGITTRQSKESMLVLSPVQGYRAIGSLTKYGDVTKGYLVSSEKWSVENLNNSLPIIKRLSLEEINVLAGITNYIVRNNNRPKGFILNRKFYEYVKNKLFSRTDYAIGIRYNALRALTISAVKSGISEEELKNDLNELRNLIISQTTVESFLPTVIDDVLKEYYLEDTLKYKGSTISRLGMFEWNPTKRNNRTKEEHLAYMRSCRKGNRKKETIKRKKYSIKKRTVRTEKEQIIVSYYNKHKNATNEEIALATGTSVSTVKRTIRKSASKLSILKNKLTRSLLRENKKFTQLEIINITGLSKGFISKNWSKIVLFMERFLTKRFNDLVNLSRKLKETKLPWNSPKYSFDVMKFKKYCYSKGIQKEELIWIDKWLQPYNYNVFEEDLPLWVQWMSEQRRAMNKFLKVRKSVLL